jgi:hypothetical protein
LQLGLTAGRLIAFPGPTPPESRRQSLSRITRGTSDEPLGCAVLTMTSRRAESMCRVASRRFGCNLPEVQATAASVIALECHDGVATPEEQSRATGVRFQNREHGQLVFQSVE